MSATVIAELKRLLVTPELAELGPGPRAGVQSEAALNLTLDGLLQKSPLPATQQQLIRALLLLWHDHLAAAHQISQAIENADGSFVHAIMHRREPDYANAKYWWRRVGDHPAFLAIAARVGERLAARGAGELAQKLLPDGKWDAPAFVDACAVGKERKWLREIQLIEFEVLLARFARIPDR